MININNTPLYKAVMKYSNSNPVPFHMPGHKLGQGMPQGPFRDIGFFDLTEIPGTDNLHFPDGAVKEAQDLAAQAFGADESYFLVNGSTVGILVTIMTICNPGDKLIVSRDCHKSVINGIMLSGAVPIYIKPGFLNKFGISTGTNAVEVERALEENPDAVGVIITRPNYYGICCDIQRIEEIIHSKGKILAVDEAHGAHLKFGDELPVCAMDAGADISVQSAHKTLPAFTQGAYLHVKGNRVDRERIRFYLRLLQTSSPSYILMTSLDMAREIMQAKGKEMLGSLQNQIAFLAREIEIAHKPIMLSRSNIAENELDTTRIVINVKNIGVTGFDMEKRLRKRYNIQVEMADFYNIVCIGTISDCREYYEALGKALKEVTKDLNSLSPLADINISELNIPPQAVDLRQISGKKTASIELKKAKGRISGAMITPYPPGIPVIVPGEIIMEDSIEYIYNIANAGGIVNGLNDKMVTSILE